ncbi:Repressor ROX1 [Mycena venus]|uniref:Repressor ROX1 n=1 Tax=Mycena venus TaxID=2733690 RepID=A0A8H6Y2H1_9AGAR|nr:Repressor ROX1 [Mycena venus]
MNSHVQIKPEDGAAPLQAEYYFPPTPPSSDSGRTTPTEWSPYNASAQSSRTTPAPMRPSLQSSPVTAPGSAPPLPPAPKSKRIPRPPNAFILYRSNLLNLKKIPKKEERRQQNLSRVAGQCWNLMTPAQKQVWQDLAAERAALHQLEYPDYHFKPSPRGKGKAKVRPSDVNSDDLIRTLREKYVGIAGPSICVSRGRKPKMQTTKETEHAAGESQSLPPIPSSVSPTEDLGTYDWTSVSASNPPAPSLRSPEPASTEPALPSFFPQRTFPHFPAPRRPSTSLGFTRNLDEDAASCSEGPERPASASSETGLSGLIRDFNITPTAANFGHIAMPGPSDWKPWPGVDQPQVICSPFTFTGFNAAMPFNPDPASGSMDTDHSSTDPTFSDAQFLTMMNGFTSDPNAGFAFDNWSFDQAMGGSDQ